MRNDEPMQSSELIEDDLKCGYSSKRCGNTRTSKKGGGLHRFCEFHRRRANANQRRVDIKRRDLRKERRQQLKRYDTARAAAALTENSDRTRPPAGAVLSSTDMELLEEMLCGRVGSAPSQMDTDIDTAARPWSEEDASLLSGCGLGEDVLENFV